MTHAGGIDKIYRLTVFQIEKRMIRTRISKSPDHDDVAGDLARCFRQFGYHGATVRRLSAFSGLAPAALARRYRKGKEDMALAALDFGHRVLIEGLRSRLKRSGSAKARCREAASFIDGFCVHAQDGGLLASFGVQDIPASVRLRTLALFHAWIDIFEAFFRESAVPRPDKEAAACVASLQGALLLLSLTRDTAVWEDALARFEATVSSAT